MVTVPAGSRTAFRRTWRFNRPNGLDPGDFLHFYIVRDAEFDERDTCETVGFVGARLRY